MMHGHFGQQLSSEAHNLTEAVALRDVGLEDLRAESCLVKRIFFRLYFLHLAYASMIHYHLQIPEWLVREHFLLAAKSR